MPAMKSRYVPILLLIFGILGSCSAQNQSDAPRVTAAPFEQAALRILVDQFYAAYAKKDLAAWMALWNSKSPDWESQRKKAEQVFSASDKIVARVIAIPQLKVEGDKAHFRVGLEMSATEVKTAAPASGLGKMVRVFDCVRENGAWKVWREADAADDLAAALVAAKSESERTDLLEQEKDLEAPRLVQVLMKQGLSLRAQGNLAEAASIFRIAQQAAEGAGDRKGMAEALLNIGIMRAMSGDDRAALEYFEKSFKLAAAVDDKRLMAHSLMASGVSHDDLGELTQALDYFNRSLEIAEALQDKYQIANLFLNMGYIDDIQGNYDQALEHFQKALTLSEAQENNNSQIAWALNHIGKIHRYRGNNALAMEYFQKSLAVLGEDGDRAVLRELSNDIGQIHKSQGDYQGALDYFEKGLAISKRMGDERHIAEFLEHIGLVEEDRGQYAAALDHFHKSLALFEKVGDKEGVLGLLGDVGEVQNLQDRNAEALESYTKALALAESQGDQASIGEWAAAVATVYNKQRKFDDALKFAQRAAEAARRTGSQDALWQARDSAGQAYQGLGQTEQARKAFEEAISAIELLRTQVAGGEEQQQSFFSERLAPYYDMVKLLDGQNQPAEALAYAERAKGRVLLDVLRSGRVRITKAMTASEREREQELQAELISLNNQVQQASAGQKPEAGELAALDGRLELARRQYSDFLVNLYAAHPELKTQRAQVQALTVEEAARLLPDSSSALLEFVTAKEKTYLFVLTRNGGSGPVTPELKVYPIHITYKELEQKAERFREQLGQRDLTFRAPSRDLFDLLLKPAQSQLAGRNTLVIVPDGPLWNLPFQALLAGNRYLLQDYAIAYAPSLTVLREMIQLRQRNHGGTTSASATTLFAMGNPAIGKEATQRVELVYRGEKLEPLPEAEKEVKMLSQLYGSGQTKVYVGAEAREDRFKAEAGTARMLHLATHGFLNDASPMYSHIVLSPAEGKTKEDGLLETWEIMQLDLKADLAVLSACETARGRIGVGEGVIGLAWAFFVAGTPTTVVSQWKVESASTTELMTTFHRIRKRELAGSRSPLATVKALQQAELQLLHSAGHTHPFYWAAFVVVGDPD